MDSFKRRFTKMSWMSWVWPNAPYTILLVGGVGVGKSSFVEFIANAIQCKDVTDYDLNVLDSTNEQDSPCNQSRTNSVHLYKFTSKNGTVVNILDTPGFPEREIQNGEAYERIKENITAVLILANGTVPRGGGDLHYITSTLFGILPNSLANNTAFMFTNIANEFSWNLHQDAIPEGFKDARQFSIDNPVALQKKFPKTENPATNLLSTVGASEQNALKTLEGVFEWLDGLEQQPTTKRQVRGSSKWVKELLRTTKQKIFIGE